MTPEERVPAQEGSSSANTIEKSPKDASPSPAATDSAPALTPKTPLSPPGGEGALDSSRQVITRAIKAVDSAAGGANWQASGDTGQQNPAKSATGAKSPASSSTTGTPSGADGGSRTGITPSPATTVHVDPLSPRLPEDGGDGPPSDKGTPSATRAFTASAAEMKMRRAHHRRQSDPSEHLGVPSGAAVPPLSPETGNDPRHRDSPVDMALPPARSRRGSPYRTPGTSSSPKALKSKNRSMKWKKGKLLGAGGFGEVYLGLDEDMGNLIAVKHVEVDTTADSEAMRLLRNELDLMASLSHPNIVKYMGMEHFGGFCNIFMEYVPGGSVLSVLEEFGPFTDEVTSSYSRQILNGLAYLHKAEVVHRDIKAANILLHSDGNLRLADFGAAVQLAKVSASDKKHELGGTVMWMPPEVIKQGTNAAVKWQQDIWSLGCTILEMLTAQTPFKWVSTDDKEVVMGLSDMEKAIQLPSSISKEASEFVLTCLKKAADDRPTAQHLLTHKYIKLSDANPVTERSRKEKPRSESPKASPKGARLKMRHPATPSKHPHNQSSPKDLDGEGQRLPPGFGRRHTAYGDEPGTPCTMLGSPTMSITSAGNASWSRRRGGGGGGSDTPLQRHPRSALYESNQTGSFSNISDVEEHPRRRLSMDVMREIDVLHSEEPSGVTLTDAMVVASVAAESRADKAGGQRVVGWLLTHINDLGANEKSIAVTPEKKDVVTRMLAQCSVRLTFIVYKEGDTVEVLRSNQEWHICTVKYVRSEEMRIIISGYESGKVFKKELSFANLDSHLRLPQTPKNGGGKGGAAGEAEASKPKAEQGEGKEGAAQEQEQQPQPAAEEDGGQAGKGTGEAAKAKAKAGGPEKSGVPEPEAGAAGVTNGGDVGDVSSHSPGKTSDLPEDASPLGCKSAQMSSLVLPSATLQGLEEESNCSPTGAASPLYPRGDGSLLRKHNEWAKGQAEQQAPENMEWCSPKWPGAHMKVTPVLSAGWSPAGSPVMQRAPSPSDCESEALIERRLSQTLPQPNQNGFGKNLMRSPHLMTFPRQGGRVSMARSSVTSEELEAARQVSPLHLTEEKRAEKISQLKPAAAGSSGSPAPTKSARPILEAARAMERHQSAASTPKTPVDAEDAASEKKDMQVPPGGSPDKEAAGRPRPRTATVTFSNQQGQTTKTPVGLKRVQSDTQSETDLRQHSSGKLSQCGTPSAMDPSMRNTMVGTPVTEHAESNGDRSGSGYSASGLPQLPVSPISDWAVDRHPTGMLYRKRQIEGQGRDTLSPTLEVGSDPMELSAAMSSSTLVVEVRPEGQDDSSRNLHSVGEHHNVALLVAALRTLCLLADVLPHDADRRLELHVAINRGCEAMSRPLFPALPSWLDAADVASELCSQHRISRPIAFNLSIGPPAELSSDRVGIQWRKIATEEGQCAFIVDEVFAQSPADRARVVSGFELLCIDGKEVRDEAQLRAALLKGVQRRGMVLCFYSPTDDEGMPLVSKDSERSILSANTVLIHTNSYGGSSSGSPLKKDHRSPVSGNTSPRSRTQRSSSHMTQFETVPDQPTIARTGSTVSLSPTAAAKRVQSIELGEVAELKGSGPLKSVTGVPSLDGTHNSRDTVDQPKSPEDSRPLEHSATNVTDSPEQPAFRPQIIGRSASLPPVLCDSVSVRPPLHPLRPGAKDTPKELDLEEGGGTGTFSNNGDSPANADDPTADKTDTDKLDRESVSMQQRFVARLKRKVPMSNVVIGVLLVLVVVLLSLFLRVYYLLVFLLMLPLAFIL